MSSLFSTSHKCPACSATIKMKSLNKPKMFRFSGFLNAGQCPSCKVDLLWHDNSKNPLKNCLLFGAMAAGLMVVIGISSGRGINIVQLLGGFVGGTLVGFFGASPKLTTKE